MSQAIAETGRGLLVSWWDEAWESGLWAAPWKSVLEGVSAEQAARGPSQGRNSIWQTVNHMCFWREHELRRLAGETVGSEEVNRRNFEAPADGSEAAWASARERFAATHRQILAALAVERSDISRIKYLLPHDSYHVGQIMTLRALHGLAPIA